MNLSPRDFVLTPMAGRKELYASTKLAIVKLSQNGEKSSQIARILDLNERTCRRVIAKHHVDGRVEN